MRLAVRADRFGTKEAKSGSVASASAHDANARSCFPQREKRPDGKFGVSVAQVYKVSTVQRSSKRMATNRNAHPKERTAAGIYPTEPPKNESVSSPKSVAGFLLLDPDLRPVSFNAETIQILSYPEDIGNVADSQLFLENKIRSILMTEASLGELLRKAPCSRP